VQWQGAVIPAPWVTWPPGSEVHVDVSKATAIPKYADRIVQEPSWAVGQAEDVSGRMKRGALIPLAPGSRGRSIVTNGTHNFR